jgi:hypothetical protein
VVLEPEPPAGHGQRTVARVIVVKASGPVNPQWSEHYDISGTTVQFRRAGEPNSPINAGVWEIEPAAAAVALLFERLGQADCSQIREILPEEAPDDGGSASYEVRYDDGSTCAVWYRDGITYAGAEPVVDAVEEFLASLALPAGATGLLVSP